MSWFINHWPGATIGRHSLSFAFAQQLPQRGSREGLYLSSGYSLNRQVTGDFHRPYETQKSLHFTIQWTTLSELVTMLQGQQFRLPGNSTGVSGQISICTNNPVAWDDNGYGIVTNGTAHRLSGNLRH